MMYDLFILFYFNRQKLPKRLDLLIANLNYMQPCNIVLEFDVPVVAGVFSQNRYYQNTQLYKNISSFVFFVLNYAKCIYPVYE